MADAPILIERAKCTGCGKCVKGCGFAALRLVDAPGANRLGRLAEVDPSACKACSACVKAKERPSKVPIFLLTTTKSVFSRPSSAVSNGTTSR